MSGDFTDIGAMLKETAVENKLPCAEVFRLIKKHSFFPDIAGVSMNENKIKITFCQLGLFGFPEGKKIPVSETVSEKMKDSINSSLEDGKLPCAAAWNIASELNIEKRDVAGACEKLGIKIFKCQLGAF